MKQWILGVASSLVLGVGVSAQAQVEERSSLLGRRNALVEMVAEAKRAVVFVQCNGVQQRTTKDLWGRPRTTHERYTSSGSGVVIFAEGYVVTNYHVVEGATEIQVLFDDDRTYEAVALSAVPEEDLALLKIQSDDEFPVISLADDEVYLAETVVAIGNPHGRTHTVSKGIVSGLHRDVTARSGNRTLQLEGLIQTDAAINLGNSGGPLLNVHGELIGINTVMETNAENIGFAIPVTRVRSVLNDTLLPVAHKYASLGFEVDPADLRVVSVLTGGPAADADVRVGDRVLTLGAKDLASPEDWSLARAGVVPGTGVPLVLERAGERVDRVVEPWNRLEALAFERFGARVVTHDVEFPVRTAFGRGTRARRLLRVVQLRPDGPAAGLGLEVGDLVDSLEVAGTRWGAFEFRQWQDFPLLLSRLAPEAELLLNVWRDRDADGALDRATELYEGRLVLD